MDMNVVNQNKAWIDEVWEKVEKKLSEVSVKSRDKIPYTTKDGIHSNETYLNKWTNGFWGGMMWLMYLATENENFKIAAKKNEEALDGALAEVEHMHHDVGFMWHLTAGASYRITGDRKSFARNMFAAYALAARYNIDGKFITAWNSWGENNYEGWSIIDCLMNIPILYWASKELNSDRLKRIAMAHCDMAIRDHIREDGSVNHIVEHKLDGGEVAAVHAGQGYSPDSCWSRGLSWLYTAPLFPTFTQEKKNILMPQLKLQITLYPM